MMHPLRSLSFCLILLYSASTSALAAAPPTTQPTLLAETPATYRRARLDGGPGKDGIPSIDRPRFGSAADAEDFLADDDRVIGLFRHGEARAYPQRILVWHEIVNDRIGEDPISVTYCPLTGTALGFHRGATELGVSGKLINSNLVMYDRATDTEFPQILASGIDGELSGRGLRETRLVWTTWGRWKARHPDTRVLTRQTGAIRNYNRDPYGNYRGPSGYYARNSRTLFPLLNEDRRFPAKHEVLGFRDAHEAVAIDPAALRALKVIEHEGPGGRYLIIHDPELDTGWVFRSDVDLRFENVEFTPAGPVFDGVERSEVVNAFSAMWFAWAAFYPDSLVIEHEDP